MQNKFLKLAFLLAAIAVALGAFGAHALKELLDASGMHTYETAVQYHFYHAVALAITGLLQLHTKHKTVDYAGRFFITGIVLFSGSLYALSLCKAAGITNMNWLGAITPFGGLCFMCGWVCLFIAAKYLNRS